MTTPPIVGLDNSQWKTIGKLLQRALPKKFRVLAFGSRLRGTHRPYSDLDLALDADSPLPTPVLLQIEEAFAESDLPFKVDICEMIHLDDDFKKHISANSLDITDALFSL